MQIKTMKIKKSMILIGLILATLLSLVLLQIARSEVISNVVDLEVGLDSEIKYTLSVSYDGVDRNGEKSKDGKITKINSDYIYVEDILPEGLEFIKFDVEGSDNQSIGAMPKYELATGSCTGHVENDSVGSTNPKSNHGLHYDEETRKVSFKVKNLSAGCKINVVIVTKTPTDIEGNRKEFYNTATAWEGSQLVYSNTVHAWIQKSRVETNTVSYQFTGTKPEGLVAPPSQEYAEGAIVTVANVPEVEGYEFLGWKVLEPLDLTINLNGQFTMPNTNVVLEGTFRELPKYEVSYKIEGDQPSGYVLPLSKEYYENAIVKVDSMKAGDTFNGYRFLGWSIDGIDISSDNDFIMPANPIEIVGRWEKIKYKVKFEFIGDIKPDDSDSLLPGVMEYAPDDIVTIENVEDVEGYHFIGWNHDYEFTMPEEDVTIYGEWQIQVGKFAPVITKEIIEPKELYKPGDKITFKITVTNNEDYSIRNVQVRENNEKAIFDAESTCLDGTQECDKLRTEHIMEFYTIAPHTTKEVYAYYDVTEEDVGTITNEVEIIGALADNYHDLDTSDEAKEKYKASVSFDIWPEIKISKIVSNEEKTDKVFQFHITSEKGYDSWINLTNKDSEIVYLEPNDTYSIKEIPSQEYTLESVSGDINYNGGSLDIKLGDKKEINFTNKHQNKGYYHSEGRVVNEVRDCETGDCTLLWRAVKNSDASKETTMDGTSNSSKIYYYDSNDNNNVLFADKCWRIVRTTDTNGVKLMYNGEPDSNGVCTESSAYVYATSGMISGYNTLIFDQLIDDPIIFHDRYMYNENIDSLPINSTLPNGESITFGQSISWDGEKYVLEPTKSISEWEAEVDSLGNYHFTCLTNDNSCEKVYYLYYAYPSEEGLSIGYITLENGDLLSDALDKMLGSDDDTKDVNQKNIDGNPNPNYVNLQNSDIKNLVDEWYENNLINYSRYIEDTVYCNDKRIYNYNMWDQNNEYVDLLGYYYRDVIYGSLGNNNLVCSRKIDSFTVDDKKGNGALTYPIGLITAQEAKLIGYSSSENNEKYLTMSPYDYYLDTNSTVSAVSDDEGIQLYVGPSSPTKYAIHPIISLKSNTLTCVGDGTKTNPYVIKTVEGGVE